MTVSRLTLTATLILALAAVAGCGRKGQLDTPTQANYEREKAAAEKAGTPPPARPSDDTPDRRFILDGLID